MLMIVDSDGIEREKKFMRHGCSEKDVSEKDVSGMHSGRLPT
jgi:hypothetical protein